MQTQLNYNNIAKGALALRGDTEYRVRFKINKAVNYGETVIVIGSIPELDRWTKQGPHHHIMRHTGNNNWESIEPLVTRSSFFHYKYACIKDNYVQYWERGIDRCADLEIAPDANKSADHMYSAADRLLANDTHIASVSDYTGSIKHIVMEEKWERFLISFMVFHPTDDGFDEMFFNCPKIGKYNEPMKPMPRAFNWMQSKYGRDVMPW